MNYSSVNLLASQPPIQSYYDAIKRGQDQLRYLRENPDENRNIKDLKFEEEEKLEAAKKKNADYQKEKEADSQLQKNKDRSSNINYNISFSAEVGVVGTALLAGGIGIASSVFQPKEHNVTVEIDSDGKNSQNEAEKIAQYDETKDVSPNRLFDDDESNKRQLSDGIIVDGFLDANNLSVMPRSDYDYDDAWLGTISYILNEDGSDERDKT